MKILLSGSSGFVGSALCDFLIKQGHDVFSLVRKKPQTSNSEIYWDIKSREIELEKIEGIEVVVHLAGANISSRRWSKSYKRELYESRIKGTSFLVDSLGRLNSPPKTLIVASAIGYYGDQGSAVLNESSGVGGSFLAQLCNDWEQEANKASTLGIRVINTRLGLVIGKGGGALSKMLLPFKLGLGGRLATGSQYMSWISLEDVIRTFEFLINNYNLSGPINIVSPNPVTNLEFTKTLGRVVRRPTLFSVPAFAIRLLFGEMGDELLLSSARVYPKQLLDVGFTFKHETIEKALLNAC
jgi:uncharacterized protein